MKDNSEVIDEEGNDRIEKSRREKGNDKEDKDKFSRSSEINRREVERSELERERQRLTFPFPFVHHQSHDWKVDHNVLTQSRVKDE